jgi:hypothetical protein
MHDLQYVASAKALLAVMNMSTTILNASFLVGGELKPSIQFLGIQSQYP